MAKRALGKGNCPYFECHSDCHKECLSEGTDCPAIGSQAYCAGECDCCIYLKTIGDRYECGCDERIDDLIEIVEERLEQLKEDVINKNE